MSPASWDTEVNGTGRCEECFCILGDVLHLQRISASIAFDERGVVVSLRFAGQLRLGCEYYWSDHDSVLKEYHRGYRVTVIPKLWRLIKKACSAT